MDTESANATPLVIGLHPEGVNDALAGEIARRVQEKVEAIAHGLTVRSVRLVPSSAMRLDEKTIQFIVNTTVVPVSQPGSRAARSKVIDSVITLVLGPNAQIKEVVVPFLERQPVAA